MNPKLTIACLVSVALCLGSLGARSSILARRKAEAARLAQLSPRATSERLAIDGLDGRIKARVKRLARR